MEAQRTPYEAVKRWTLVRPPNIFYDVVGQRELDHLGCLHRLDIGNLHQVCAVSHSATPAGRAESQTRA